MPPLVPFGEAADRTRKTGMLDPQAADRAIEAARGDLRDPVRREAAERALERARAELEDPEVRARARAEHARLVALLKEAVRSEEQCLES